MIRRTVLVVTYVKVVVLRWKCLCFPVKGQDAPKAVVKTLGAAEVQHPGHPFRPRFEPWADGARSEVGAALARVRHAEGVRHFKAGGADLHWSPAGNEQEAISRMKDWNSGQLVPMKCKNHPGRSLVSLFWVFWQFVQFKFSLFICGRCKSADHICIIKWTQSFQSLYLFYPGFIFTVVFKPVRNL